MVFNPDSDGFVFGIKEAKIIHNNMNILQFIRRNLGISGHEKTSKGRQFDQGIENLETKYKEELAFTSMKITIGEDPQAEKAPEVEDQTPKVPKNLTQIIDHFWDCKKHDKGLLRAVAQNGFKYLNQLPGNQKFGFEDISEDLIMKKLSPDLIMSILGETKENQIAGRVLQKRIEEICQTYKEQ